MWSDCMIVLGIWAGLSALVLAYFKPPGPPAP